MNSKFKSQSEFCKLFGHEKRLQILQVLRDGEKHAGNLCDILGVSPANLSQHISLLKRSGAIRDRRKGNNIYYEVGHEKIIQAIDMMESALQDIVTERQNDLAKQEESEI